MKGNLILTVSVALGAMGLLISLGGCGTGSVTEAPFKIDRTLVVGSVGQAHKPAQEVQIAVYMDATTSMAGFASPEGSYFDHFVSDIDAITQVGWVVPKVSYYQFGTSIREIGRQKFLTAAEAGSFYSEPGIFQDTNIDLVLDSTDSQKVNLVITDLFQREQDLNVLVAKIRDKCFGKKLQLAILAIPSQFDGSVHDANVPPYQYTSQEGKKESYRPFYVLMFGDPDNLERCFEFLRTNEYVDQELFLTLSPILLSDFQVSLQKTKDSKGLGRYRAEKDPLMFYFKHNRKISGDALEVEVKFQPKAHAPDFDPAGLQLTVQRKAYENKVKRWSSGQEETTDLTPVSFSREGNMLRCRLDIHLEDAAGHYGYLCELGVSPINGLVCPDWVRRWSSENPTASHEPNKTLNLERFVTNLMRASATIHQPKVGCFALKIKQI